MGLVAGVTANNVVKCPWIWYFSFSLLHLLGQWHRRAPRSMYKCVFCVCVQYLSIYESI